uniref:Kinesin motor protein n=1 Tax=Ganoderma boninense TaxID=34458 RepID=A0A5K1K320_9APHY|nr:Kinesin motor protein [Ganoderma boninense]
MITSDMPFLKPPLFHLPNEILSPVFEIVANLEEHATNAAMYYGLRRDTSTLMKWVRLMLVCRHWRYVGLSSPCLWRRISVTENLQSLQYRLARAVGCTIDVFLAPRPVTNESAMPLLLSLAPQIRAIHSCDSFVFKTLPSIKALFQLSLPSLESIVLLPDDVGRFPQVDDSLEELKEWFDLGLCSALLPRLRKLEIRRIVMPPPPASFTALRELIINMEQLKYPPLGAQDVVQILAHSPQLEMFKIVSSHLWEYSSSSQAPANVEPGKHHQCRLPFLREVDISCPYDFATEILQAVDAPDLCLFRAKVFVHTPVVAGDIGSRIFPPSLRHFVHRLTSFRIVPTAGSYGFYIHGTPFPAPRRSRHNRSCFWAEVAVEDHTATIDALDAALDTACTVLAGAPLARLAIADFELEVDEPPPETWQRLDRTFPALDSLRVGQCSEVVAASFLTAFAESSTEEGSWPALRRLSINTQSWDCFALNSVNLYDIFTLVLDALRARRERAADVVALSLEHEMRSSAPLTAHRWMLRDISSLCGGQFRCRICKGDARPFQVELSDLFESSESRMLSAREECATATSGDSDTGGVSSSAVLTGRVSAVSCANARDGGERDEYSVSKIFRRRRACHFGRH